MTDTTAQPSLRRLPANPPGIRPLHTPETERLARLYPDLQRGRHHPDLDGVLLDCRTCSGTGRFRWYDNGEPTDWECNCIEQFFLNRYFLHSGIEDYYQRLRWKDATGVPEKAVKAIFDYVDKSRDYVRAGIGLQLTGKRGTGKSMVSTLVLKMLLFRGQRGFFTTFNEMLDHYSDGWRSKDDKSWYQQRIRNARVLVIDDIGRESGARGSVAESALDDVLRHRVACARPTIVTSNLDDQTLGERYSLNALSLLSERSIPIVFDGADWRPNVRMRSVEETGAGLRRPVVFL
jgi:DNA replication protein DnaC